MIEIEKKYKVPQEVFDGIKKDVESSKAERLDEAEESNVLYTGTIRQDDEVYRIRTLNSISGINSTVFTFKRKLSSELGLKQYTELEFSVPGTLFHEFLVSGLGLQPYLLYEKKRQSFGILAGTICLDTLSFGTFIEIEGAEKMISLIEREYQLKDFVEIKTYPDMTKEFGIVKDGIYQSRFLKTL